MNLVGGSEASMCRTIEKLASLLAEESRFSKGIKISEVESLKRELEIIWVLVMDIGARSVEEELSHEVNLWLKQTKEVAELIEDVVDKYVFKASQLPGPRHSSVGFVGRDGQLIETFSQRRLSSNIQSIKALLLQVQKQGQRHGIINHLSRGEGSTTVSDRYRSYTELINPNLPESNVGIDSVAYELMDLFLGGKLERSVLSIVGIGGVGKTTLAKRIYDLLLNDNMLYDYTERRKRFIDHAWITVSASYDLKDILIDMVRQFGAAGDRDMQREELIDTLWQDLRSKRYLLVFDDVWKENFWQVMRRVLPNNGKGSRIIITTRRDSVAAFCEESSFDLVHRMEPLTETLSRDLFCRRAFHLEHEGRCPPELEQLSLEFLRMCRGLPLAIVAVADVLSTKEKTRSEWQRIYDNFKFEIESNPHLEDISRLLVFSFRDLPYQLKMCFLYFSIFPEGYLIPKDKLFKLWIAEDFVQATGLKTSEEVAEEYLNELIQRNLVQACEGYYALENFCRVQDSMLQLVRQEADEIGFCQIRDDKNSSFRGKSRRLSISGNIEKNFLKTIEDCQVRSVFLSNIGALENSFLVTVFHMYKLLTLLDVENVPLDRLPEKVGNLFHLKYLSLKNTKVKKLPKSVGKLHNLHTLDVRNTLLVELPIEINELLNLQHLLASRSDSAINLSPTKGVRIKEGIGYLDNLKTLMTVEARHNGIGLEEELEKLTGLRRLGISRLTTAALTALCPSIGKMNDLEYLSLHSVTSDEILDLQTISSPPLLLQSLILRGQLQMLPNWVSSLQLLSVLCLSLSRLTDDPLQHICALPNLVSLWLYRAYEGEQLHFVVGGFRKLKLLVLRDLQRLEVLEIEEGALPLLEELRIGPSPLLNEVPSGIQHLRGLKVLAFYDMPNEFVSSMQPDGGTKYVLIEHVPSVLFWYRVQGRNYASYKLGESDLLARFQDLATNNINDVVQNNLRLSFCYSDDEANSAPPSSSTAPWDCDRMSFCYSDDEANSAPPSSSTAPWDRDRMSFSSDRFSFFSDDIED